MTCTCDSRDRAARVEADLSSFERDKLRPPYKQRTSLDRLGYISERGCREQEMRGDEIAKHLLSVRLNSTSHRPPFSAWSALEAIPPQASRHVPPGSMLSLRLQVLQLVLQLRLLVHHWQAGIQLPTHEGDDALALI